MLERLYCSYLICEIKDASQWINWFKDGKDLLANVVRHFFLTQDLAFTVTSLNVNPTYMFITRKIINAHNTLTATAVLRMNYKLKALNFGNRRESDDKVRVFISSF